MKNHGMNPYLPSWEYVPDGEPHVFGKRVYIYGSHDRFAGFCTSTVFFFNYHQGCSLSPLREYMSAASPTFPIL